MSYKNTVKLFASNFTLVWKQVLYTLICTLIFTLLSYSTISPVLELLEENNIFLELENLFEVVYASPKELALTLSDWSKHFIDVLFSNISSIIWNLIGTAILGVFLPYIAIQMSFFNISSIMHQKMTMNMDVPYTQNFISNLWISFRYAIAKFVLNLPFLAVLILLIEIYLMIATTILASLVGLVFLSALLIFFTSAQITLFSCQTGYMIEHKVGPFVAFGKSLTSVLKRFWRIMSMSIAIVFTLIFVNSFIIVFTFFSGSIVMIPASYLFMAIFNIVVYLTVRGERYYLGNNLIFNPSKYVVKQDEFVESTIPEEIKEIEVTTAVMKKKKVKKPVKNSKKKTNVKK